MRPVGSAGGTEWWRLHRTLHSFCGLCRELYVTAGSKPPFRPGRSHSAMVALNVSTPRFAVRSWMHGHGTRA